MRVRWESRLFVLIKERAMDGALEFDKQGRESNSNKANTGFHNKFASARGTIFFPPFLCSHKERGSPTQRSCKAKLFFPYFLVAARK